MKKLILLTFIVLISGTCAAVAKITDSKQFNGIFMNYFIKKNTAQLPEMINFISENNLYEVKNSKSPLYGFFAGIKHETPAEFGNLEKMNVTDSTRKMLKSAKEYEFIVQDILKRNNYYLESPAALDAFWGYFFATGDERIIKKLCYTEQNSPDYLVKAAAEWSLNSNRKQYPWKIKACSAYK